MAENKITGSFTEMDSGEYYKIENVQDMAPFFINIATASDIWIFLSSNGALTAGRQNAEGALFPYETDDRLHLATSTGPKTLIRLSDGRIWEPFDVGRDNPYTLHRNIYKRLTGDAILFEEINESIGLKFTYRLESSEKYGIVRTACLRNLNDHEVTFALLDGVQNIIPYGIPQGLADNSSCLTDAYKACERIDGCNLAVYSLTSMIVDTPEPIEVLRANVVWRIGEASAYLLSSKQISAFCSGSSMIEDEKRSVGRKGAYLAYRNLTLASGAEDSWLLVLDARLSQKQISVLMKELRDNTQDELRTLVESDIARGTMELLRIVAAADGLQHTADRNATIRHYMNVLYNNMRGGVFLDGYSYDPELFEHFVTARNRNLPTRRTDFFEKLKQLSDHNILHLHEMALLYGDPDLFRLCLEFLPLTFSRRHGDPSRPWNHFNIRVKDDSGNRLYSYEGNWRDIFQNWEAMSLSFPKFIAPIIVKFLNASTIDGFNPYRISSDGIDWEYPQPDNPFSSFGYWGDHQIVYLNKLLEWLNAYEPDQLAILLENPIFTYADLPYEIKPYNYILKDAKNTIAFNYERNEAIKRRAEMIGADGKLLACGDSVYHTSFTEKLLIPILAKLSNLVPKGGIWMNTQRPEWNDANNAIVGNGLSMVTVYQLYRHLVCCKEIFKQASCDEFQLSAEVWQWLDDIYGLLNIIKEKTAREFLDEAGLNFERYRTLVYAHGFSGNKSIGKTDLLRFIDQAVEILSETIDANKREDGLYNAYNILQLSDGDLTVSPLFLMLEGQTAVLSSGLLTPDEALALVKSMEKSDLYSCKHHTFYLYPVKKLNTFMKKNIIPPEDVSKSALISRLLEDGSEGLLLKDEDGHVRFNDNIQQSSDLENSLKRLQSDDRYALLADSEAGLIWDIYERVFNHKQFTGRSGIMYKYEGIGSIYWHQNSKFLVSFQEAFKSAEENHYFNLKGLKDAYYRLRDGFGFNKEPALWGAFPLEPYSHTPYGQPAQQPGMTGQVKEDILTRLAELGICVKEGILHFDPALLRRKEFLIKPSVFHYIDVTGKACDLPLDKGTLAFTVCQTPVVYKLSPDNSVKVFSSSGQTIFESNGLELTMPISDALFSRDGSVYRIEVCISEL